MEKNPAGSSYGTLEGILKDTSGRIPEAEISKAGILKKESQKKVPGIRFNLPPGDFSGTSLGVLFILSFIIRKSF